MAGRKKAVAETAEIVKQEPAKVAVVAKKAEEIKAEVKEAEAKPEEKETEAKAETAEVKAEEPKTEEPKKAPAKKTTAAKKVAEKKAPAKKAATKKSTSKKEVVSAVILQFDGKEVAAKEVMENAKNDWIAAGHKEEDLKSITLYIKPEENTAYYVINDGDTGSVGL